MDKAGQVLPSLGHLHSQLEQHSSGRSGTVHSKIPRFQRSQSLRLKGERAVGGAGGGGGCPNNSPGNCCDHDHDTQRSRNNHKVALTLANLRTFQPASHNGHFPAACHFQHGPYGPCPSQTSGGERRSLQSSSSTLRSSSVGGGRAAPTSGRGQQAGSPSEYGSLPVTPVPSPDAEDDDDEDGAGSVRSFRSFCSAVSLDTYHLAGIRGGVATSGGRRKKYAVHCPSHHEDEEEYLTPTQRKDRLIRQLKAMLVRARRELDEKDAEIVRLTKQVLDKKVFDPANKNDAVAPPSRDLDSTFKSPQDSGHFEQSSTDAGTSVYAGGGDHGVSTSCKDGSTNTELADEHRNSRRSEAATPSSSSVPHGYSLEACLKREIEQVKRHHAAEYQELKERYNDRVENLLQKLSEANTKYFDLRPKYDHTQERIRQLEKQCQSLEKQLSDDDKRHNQMYLKMYKKGQEAAKFEHADEVLEFAHHAPTRVSVPELLQQLKVTEHELHQVKSLYRREIYKQTDSMEKDSEITLRFLKDAIYHFLTNKESRDHLKAIESIMGYNEKERHNIEKSMFSKNKFM